MAGGSFNLQFSNGHEVTLTEQDHLRYSDETCCIHFAGHADGCKSGIMIREGSERAKSNAANTRKTTDYQFIEVRRVMTGEVVEWIEGKRSTLF